ncbi:MAG: CHC2 zinc finger domain-containing protein, partial [Aquificaceae bacterium]
MPTLKDLLGKIDIVDVISSYIELKRVGNNYAARCPFHPDDTPSFYVSPSKGIFKCFGCGVGGDAIKFVSMYENIDYWEAVEKLA